MKVKLGSVISGAAAAGRDLIYGSRTWAFRRWSAQRTRRESIAILRALIGVLRWLAFAICLPLAGQDAALQVRIVEGEGMGYAAGSRATRGISVQVFDGDGKPVSGANVTFQLPENGPTGVFSSGSRMELAVTGSDGRTSVWGMRWNRVTGPFELRVSATKNQMRGSAACPLELTEAEVKVGRSHRKLIWIGLAIGGGVAGAVMARGAISSASTAGTTPVNPPAFGNPTIAISHP